MRTVRCVSRACTYTIAVSAPAFSRAVQVSESGGQCSARGSSGRWRWGRDPRENTGSGDWRTVSNRVNHGLQPLTASRIGFVEIVYSHSLMAAERGVQNAFAFERSESRPSLRSWPDGIEASQLPWVSGLGRGLGADALEVKFSPPASESPRLESFGSWVELFPPLSVPFGRAHCLLLCIFQASVASPPPRVGAR